MKILLEFDVQIRFDPHDLWIGVYWMHERPQSFDGPGEWKSSTTLFICPLPTLVIRFRRDKYGAR